MSDEQGENLWRVTDRIGCLVADFCWQCLSDSSDPTFYMRELESRVRRAMAATFVAPDSPSRILRALRQRGVLDYVVLNRRQSWYQVTRCFNKRGKH